MPHYVNIAWGNFFGHVFLPEALAQLFDPAVGVGNVLHVGRAKSMTEKITEGQGRRGAAPKNAGANGRFL